MSTQYTLNWADPVDKAAIIIAPATVDSTSVSFSLFGKGAPNYGQGQQESFIQMLENFSSATEPLYSTKGQLWYKSDTALLMVHNGTAYETIIHAHETDFTLHLTSAQNTLLDGLSPTLTSAQLNYVEGVTSGIQAQIDAKAPQATTYTKTEVDNALSALVSNLEWKNSVATYADLATTYPTPLEGWTVSVDDTNIVYRYDALGLVWNAISSNAIPLATAAVNGLMAATDKNKLDGIEAGAQVNPTAAVALALIETVDGVGSGLDADLLDGQQGAYYLPASSYTAADILAKIETVDGAASGLDADLLDGQQGSYYYSPANPQPFSAVPGTPIVAGGNYIITKAGDYLWNSQYVYYLRPNYVTTELCAFTAPNTGWANPDGYNYASGTVRAVFYVPYFNSNAIGRAWITKNGVQVSGTFSIGNVNPSSTYSFDVGSLASGDTIALYGYSTHGSIAGYITWFGLSYGNTPTHIQWWNSYSKSGT